MRPGHISPCTGSQCPMCHGRKLEWSDLVAPSHSLGQAVHMARNSHNSENSENPQNSEMAAKLWRAKKLVDEVRDALPGPYDHLKSYCVCGFTYAKCHQLDLAGGCPAENATESSNPSNPLSNSPSKPSSQGRGTTRHRSAASHEARRERS
jgi:hypothetical protein